MTFAIYIHFPFCERKCPYCDFYSLSQAGHLTDQFLTALHKEIQHYSQSIPYKGSSVATIYFGGGTPSLLSANQTASLLDSITRNFDICKDAEITCEANPGTLSLDKLRGYRDSGVNRLTLGIQSLNDKELRTLGRIHNFTDAMQACNLARAAGFVNFAVDLIFAIPGQSLKSWQATLEKIIDLHPEHISTYCLSFEPGTPFERSLKSGEIHAVDEEIQRDLYLLAIELLKSAGYEHYEILNYALPRFRSRHNISYWDGTTYLGLGPSAHSFNGAKRWQNIADVSGYIEKIMAGKSAVAEVEELTRSQKMLEFIMLGLRRREGIDFKKFSEHFSLEFLDLFGETISQIESNWLPEKNDIRQSLFRIGDDKAGLSKEGFLLYDQICTRIACSQIFDHLNSN